MIVSPQSGFLFIHVPHTGGISLTSLLRHSLPDATGMGGPHSSARWAMKVFGTREFRQWRSFAVVRNPWDRMVSEYARQCRVGKITPADMSREAFTAYLLACARCGLPPSKCQMAWICDARGRVAVKEVLRFEEYALAVADICRRFGLDVQALPHLNATPHEHYTYYYTDETRKIASRWFAGDIKLFGYTFGK